MKDIKKFDPYEILEISTSDELPSIKRAYRYHMPLIPQTTNAKIPPRQEPGRQPGRRKVHPHFQGLRGAHRRKSEIELSEVWKSGWARHYAC
jgi:hypothetical protein